MMTLVLKTGLGPTLTMEIQLINQTQEYIQIEK